MSLLLACPVSRVPGVGTSSRSSRAACFSSRIVLSNTLSEALLALDKCCICQRAVRNHHPVRDVPASWLQQLHVLDFCLPKRDLQFTDSICTSPPSHRKPADRSSDGWGLVYVSGHQKLISSIRLAEPHQRSKPAVVKLLHAHSGDVNLHAITETLASPPLALTDQLVKLLERNCHR